MTRRPYVWHGTVDHNGQVYNLRRDMRDGVLLRVCHSGPGIYIQLKASMHRVS
jgi:hypothetical protein